MEILVAKEATQIVDEGVSVDPVPSVFIDPGAGDANTAIAYSKILWGIPTKILWGSPIFFFWRHSGVSF